MPTHSRPIAPQLPEPDDLVARFNQIVDGGCLGLASASADLDRTLAEDAGLVDVRLANWVAFAVNGVLDSTEKGKA